MKLILMTISISFIINVLFLMSIYFIEKYNIKKSMELLYPTDYEKTKIQMWGTPITIYSDTLIYIRKDVKQ